MGCYCASLCIAGRLLCSAMHMAPVPVCESLRLPPGSRFHRCRVEDFAVSQPIGLISQKNWKPRIPGSSYSETNQEKRKHVRHEPSLLLLGRELPFDSSRFLTVCAMKGQHDEQPA